ncbi:MAG TPA: hypothetical protein P5556_09565 [Candidatus Gastranaerophilales bacterium]|nr:hypothetical protein [Candidatus Gastranaerophilales bacterium]
MKNFFIKLILLCFVSGFLCPVSCSGQENLDYNRLYEDMPILDFMYEAGFDPEESEDYEKYFISPYVLIRLPVVLKNKKTVLLPGYYLVKPEKKDGYNFAVFKQNGRIKGIIPVYKKYIVNPAEIFPEPEKPKHKFYIKPFVYAGNVIKWPFSKIFKKRNPPAPPRAAVEFELVGNDRYYDMGLYVEDSLYKMLFIMEK